MAKLQNPQKSQLSNKRDRFASLSVIKEDDK